MKKIIHIDMDAFFASIEQRDHPDFRGQPVVVGGDPNGRGVVAAASYEARKFGIRSAMSCRAAKKSCPYAIFVRPRFDVYRQASRQIQEIFASFTPLVEPLSLDEAYLDVTDCPHFGGSATLIAKAIKARIFDTTGLTASAGISFNKMLAKIASDLNKPNGITIITPEQAPNFVDNLPIERFFGIGHSTAKRLHTLGIYTGADLKSCDPALLNQRFGKRGLFYHDIAHLRDERAVKPDRIRKSIGSETTFDKNLADDSALLSAIYNQTQDAFSTLVRRKQHSHTITLKVKFSDFRTITRSHSQKRTFISVHDAYLIAKMLFASIDRTLPIRLIGISFSKLEDEKDEQLLLF